MPLNVADFADDFPGDELVIYRSHVYRSPAYPNGLEVLIHIPLAKIEELRREGKPLPFWRHGEVMNVRPGPNT